RPCCPARPRRAPPGAASASSGHGERRPAGRGAERRGALSGRAGSGGRQQTVRPALPHHRSEVEFLLLCLLPEQALHDENPPRERPGAASPGDRADDGSIGDKDTCSPAPPGARTADHGKWHEQDAKDLEQLSRNKITHIVSIHESPQPLLQDITYLRIPLPDTPEANIKKHFKECISFIHQCRLHGGNCLVHCLAGISRSTTVVVAYVMAVTELSSQEVLEAIRSVRPVANPNPGFRQQLEEFGSSAARKIRRHLRQRYGSSPFNDEEEIKALLPVGRGAPRAEGARQGLVPRARDIKSTAPFLLRVKRTFSCIPACLK
uniref:Dual specificity protein phosphatase 15 n=1 Tax=Anas platyrhynchos TaxID=8839 RepID=A0A8B9SQF4_ANAPL